MRVGWKAWLATGLALVAVSGFVVAQQPTRGALSYTPSQAGASPVTLYKSSKALVIGIDAYTEKGWPPLRNAIRDAEAVAKALDTHGFDVTLRKNLKSDQLYPVLRDFFIRQGADPEARLLLWFAGHGHTLTSPIEEGYLVPADAPSAEDSIGFRDKALAMRQFGYLMTQANAKHVLAVFDSCFSGTALDITRQAEITAPPEILLSAGGKSRQIISSGDRNQKVSDNGTFQKLFVDAISGAVPRIGRDGWVTGQELGIYLRGEMTALTARSASPQTPNVGYLNQAGFNRGDFVFGPRMVARRPDPPPPPPPVLPPPATVTTASREWQDVKNTTSISVLERYADKHKSDALYSALAQERLAALRLQQQTAVAKNTEPPPVQSTEPKAPPQSALTLPPRQPPSPVPVPVPPTPPKAVAALEQGRPRLRRSDPIKIGILHSMSGTMAASETPLKDAVLYLIDEQNKRGGVLGRKLEAIVVDPASNWPLFAEKARELISKEKVSVTFGGWTSVARKAVLPVFRELNSILFYPVQYEGEESERNVFYTGATPNQQAIPAVDYLLSKDGGEVKRFVLAGTEYAYPRTTNKILEAYLLSKGVRQDDILINYTHFGHSDWGGIVAAIRKFGAAGKKTAVVSTIDGDANISFYKELANQGVRATHIPVVALAIDEVNLAGIDPKHLVGHLAARNYFQSVKTPGNDAFIAGWKAFTNDARRVSTDAMEAHAIGFSMWVKAVEKAGNLDPDKVIDALVGIEVPNLSGGTAKMLPNHHITKPVLIGEIRADGQFDVVWKTTSPIAADAWSDYLEGSKDLEADWIGKRCGRFVIKTGKCG